MTPQIFALTLDTKTPPKGKAVQLKRIAAHPSKERDVTVMGTYVDDSVKSAAKDHAVPAVLAYFREALDGTSGEAILDSYLYPSGSANDLIPCGLVCFEFEENRVSGIVGSSATLAFATAFAIHVCDTIFARVGINSAEVWPKIGATGAINTANAEEGLLDPLTARILEQKAAAAVEAFGKTPAIRPNWLFHSLDPAEPLPAEASRRLAEANVKAIGLLSLPQLLDFLVQEAFTTAAAPHIEELSKQIINVLKQYRNHNKQIKSLNERLHCLAGYEALFITRGAEMEKRRAILKELRERPAGAHVGVPDHLIRQLREIKNPRETPEAPRSVIDEASEATRNLPQSEVSADLSQTESDDMRQAFVRIMKVLVPILNGPRIDHDYIEIFNEVKEARDQSNSALVSAYALLLAGIEDNTDETAAARFAWGIDCAARLSKISRELSRIWSRAEQQHRRLAPESESIEQGIEALKKALEEQNDTYQELSKELKPFLELVE